jgi:choline dehydrogenase-like flavoprotein
MTESYDVIIVGTGAGGGTLARTLAPSGKRILLLERGDFLTRESENWDPGPVFVDGRYVHQGRVAVPGTRRARHRSHRRQLVEAVPVAAGLP